MTTNRTVELAYRLGGHAADAYWDEFHEKPVRGACRDWVESAWGLAEKELRDDGMTDDGRDCCLSVWRSGFFGTDD